MELPYRDRWVFITGAGMLGRIGATCALYFAERGANVYLHEVRATADAGRALDAVLERARLSGGTAELVVGDLTEPSIVAGLFSSMRPLPDIVINNAGVFRPARVQLDQPLHEYLAAHNDALTKNVDGNMRTALLVTEAAVYAWKHRGMRGTVVFEGDAFIERSGSYPRNLAAYTSSKAFIPSVVHQLAEQHGRDGIRFLGVLNGTIEPPQTASAATIEHMRTEIPLPKEELLPWIGAERVAEAIDRLIGMRAVNGTTLTVDGGRTWTTKEEF